MGSGSAARHVQPRNHDNEVDEDLTQLVRVGGRCSYVLLALLSLILLYPHMRVGWVKLSCAGQVVMRLCSSRGPGSVAEPVARMRYRHRISSHSVAVSSRRPHHDPSYTRYRARGTGPLCCTACLSQPIQRPACPGSGEVDQTSRMRVNTVPLRPSSAPHRWGPHRGSHTATGRRGASGPAPRW